MTVLHKMAEGSGKSLAALVLCIGVCQPDVTCYWCWSFSPVLATGHRAVISVLLPDLCLPSAAGVLLGVGSFGRVYKV
jgi:hypothetical protein